VFVTDLDPAVMGTTSVGIGGWSNEDEMGMKFFGKIWNLVAGSDSSNEYPTSATAGATIYTVPVSPATIDSGYASAASPVFQAPMMIGMHCVYWRGRCRVKLMVFAGA
jgi:hypothetical protein